MSPAIEAAWIAAGVSLASLGGTVVVAIGGFRNTRRATTQTVSAGTADTVRALDAARSDRLWDKQTATYASDTIVDAYEAAHFADREVYELYQAWKRLRSGNGTPSQLVISVARRPAWTRSQWQPL